MIPLLRAMQRRVVAGAVGAGLISMSALIACAPDNITRVPGSLSAPSGISRNVTPVAARVLKVCTGDGPAGTYTYQLSNIIPGAGSRGTPTSPLGPTFSVASGSCADVEVLTFPYLDAEIDQPTSITVTEIARPAGTTFNYVQATQLIQSPQDQVCLAPANFPCGQDTQIFTPNPTIVINEYHGSVLSFFHNSASLGDFVWSDTNGNGIQDAGEPGIPGITVTLSGAVSATTVTGPNGEYEFTGLPAGTYGVTLATPAGMTASPVSAAGSTPSNDSNGSGTSVTLAAAESNQTIDFGFVPPRFVIGDRVWTDTNGDGVQDAGEAGINGVTVTINGPDGYTATTTTAGDGIYAFNNLLAGSYTVCTTAGIPASYTQTYDLDGIGTPNCATVTVGPSTTAVDFGYKPPRFSLGDRVWTDVNANGAQDAGETGITGVTVTITGAGGFSATTTTGADGIYGFSDLLAGTYTVCTTTGVPAGYSQTYDLDGIATPNCASVVLSANRDDVDFGYTPPRYAIGDRVWGDTNGDGVQDAGEAGINGVTVTISGPGGYSSTTTTAGDGIYAFNNLLPGTYTVCTTTGIPASYTQTYDLDGLGTPNCATVTVGPSTTAVDFGYKPPRFSIGDRVWSDVNSNGVQDAGEVGLNGVTVTIAGPGGYSASTTTAGDGIYGFSDLLAGSYTVCTAAGVPAGYSETYDLDGLGTPNCATVSVGPSTTAVDFGYTAPRFSIGDRVWVDANGDGVQDAGEAGIPGVTVSISGPGGYTATTTTGANGIYGFSGLLVGSYTVCTTAGVPAGYSQTYDLDGTGTPNCATVTLTASRSDVDFGYKAPPPVTGTCVAISATQGVAITPVTLVGSGGIGAPYTFTATGLPDGLVISTDGTISGTPNVSGTFTYTVTIKDGAGNVGTFNCTITVNKPSTPSYACLSITVVQGSPISAAASQAIGTAGPYTYAATGLPTGVSMAADGTISGTPTVSGTFTYTVTVTDKYGNKSTFTCSILVKTPPPPSCACGTISAVKDVAITPVTLVGSGGAGGPYTFSATGLPTGVTISSTGKISGTPSVTGTFNYTVTTKDKYGNASTLNCTIIVSGPPSASCITINAVKGKALVPVTLVGTGGAGGAYTFSATGLPTGVVMSSSGVISGTPSVGGTFNYTVTIKDKNGNVGTFDCSVTVSVPDTTPPVCSVYENASPAYMTYQDVGSGLVRLDVTTNLNSNFAVTVTPAFSGATQGSAMKTGTVLTFATPQTGIVKVSAVRVDKTKSAQLTVKATDAAGNTVSCDPVETTLTKMKQDNGDQTFTNIPYEEHFITVENGGLRAIDIDVNGTTFKVKRLDDDEVRTIDVSSAMKKGKKNTITLSPKGKKGDTADVTIGPDGDPR